MPLTSDISNALGMLSPSVYNMWQAEVVVGNSATGAQTITVVPGFVTLPDGTVFSPFSTTASITLDFGANAETVTPTTVTLVNTPQTGGGPSGAANITATFSNTHGQGTRVFSGTSGVAEAAAAAVNTPASLLGLKCSPQTLSVNGAIPPHAEALFVITKAGVLADTLAAPTATVDDGKIIIVTSNTANAHTITATGLLQTGTASVNVATFAAQAGAGVILMAYQAKWNVLASVGITFS